jgi:general secretion pathway protein E
MELPRPRRLPPGPTPAAVANFTAMSDVATLDSTLPAELAEGLDEEKRQAIMAAPRGRRLADLAAALGQDEGKLLTRLAELAGLPIARDLVADQQALRLFPARLINDYQLVPVLGPEAAAAAAAAKPGTPAAESDEAPSPDTPLLVVTAWPPDAMMTEWIRTFTIRPVVWHLGQADKIHQLILDRFGVGAGSLDDDDAFELAQEEQVTEDVDEEAAVVRFVTDVITQAVADGATDIHFEPQETQLRIRYRVDGLLVHVPVPENLRRFQAAIISRVKIMAKLNISEQRLPQDGRINFRAGGAVLDIRVSTLPTIYAESISLRLLDKKKDSYATMEKLGMSAEEQAPILEVLDYPHGIILVTGPTGSGKSTTLNAFLRKINSPDLRIMTVEDPIEYEVPGVNQTQTKTEIGLTFASALRSLLRQDPDVIMVGEIRDRETADIAVRASLTGHLVFSTLHTNDAPGAITRLIDMGIEPFLVASSIELVLAQRLVRRLCQECAQPQPISQVKLREHLSVLRVDPDQAAAVTHLKQPVGCDRCRKTGYRGRVGVFEIFRLDNDEIHELVLKRESTRALADCARRHGMKALEQSAWEKVRSGFTTMDEVLRVITVVDKG